VPLVIYLIYLCYIIGSLAISLYISLLYLRSHFVPKIIRIKSPLYLRMSMEVIKLSLGYTIKLKYFFPHRNIVLAHGTKQNDLIVP
jgi:hypothetical protein